MERPTNEKIWSRSCLYEKTNQQSFREKVREQEPYLSKKAASQDDCDTRFFSKNAEWQTWVETSLCGRAYPCTNGAYLTRRLPFSKKTCYDEVSYGGDNS